MDALAAVGLHGIQTSGNCIRNVTTDAYAGVAPDEIADPRPWCEIIRQWSTLHPEFATLPRKFKIAVSGAEEDRAAIGWHDIGLQLRKNESGDLGFEVRVGGGMGRTPIAAPVLNAFVPWQDILTYLEATLRTYNLFGRRDNLYKARIKILVKAEGAAFTQAVEAEFATLQARGPAHRLTEAVLSRFSAHFEEKPGVAGVPSHFVATQSIAHEDAKAYSSWTKRNLRAHRVAGFKAVALSLKRAGQAPGDMTSAQLRAAADLAERFSAVQSPTGQGGELRVTHEQNLVLPWVREADLPALYLAAKAAGLAAANLGLLSDLIACPGGDFCALANARSLPIAEQLLQRYEDIDELQDIGDIDLHISGCINSCGHHHSGHIGVLGVDKDGQEWYQITLGGSDGSALSGDTQPGKVVGPSFAADEVPDVVEALIDTYLAQRDTSAERFVDALKRLGHEPFKAAANAARRSTARQPVAA
jgi:sulfite reductase (NADPH) hemoprotein beta-component